MKRTSRITALIKALTGLLSESARNKAFEPDMTMNISPNPFEELPNISALRLKTNKEDPLLAKHGISKKLEPEFDFRVLSHRTKAANRYIRIMYTRLTKLQFQGRNIEFWILALMLMKKSKVLRAVALRKLEKNWYRVWTFGKVKKLMTELDNLIDAMPFVLHVVRDYAAKVKPDQSITWRPIGAPAYAVRMYLYLLQSFLVIFLNPHISRSQHAYRPGKGVVTALREVQDCLEKYKYVWEFDLKGAFPSVKITLTCDKLIEVGVPRPVAEYLKQMSLATVERVDLSRKGRLLDEPKFDRQAELIKLLPDTWLNPPIPAGARPNQPFQRYPLPDGREVLMAAGHDKYVQMYIMDMVTQPGHVIVKILERWEALEMLVDVSPGARMLHTAILEAVDKMEKEFFKGAYKDMKADTTTLEGFPQGFGTSPVLFNFAFEMFALRDHFMKLHPSVKVVSYADDFLVFSQVPLHTIMELPNNGSGLKVNLEKSRAVIADGKPLVKSFKYLGATVHFADHGIVWEGTPRSGTHLIFDKELMVKDFEYREEELRKFISGVKDAPRSPGAVVSAWGLGEYPSALLPEDVIRGEAPVTAELIKSINQVYAESYLDGIPTKLKAKVSAIADFSENLRLRLKSVKPWLRTRIAGLLVNRLHSGSWETPEILPDTTQSRVEGSWLDLRTKSKGPAIQARLNRNRVDLTQFLNKKFTGNLEEYKAHLNSLTRALKLVELELKEQASFVTTNSIYTGTSLATVDLLNHLKKPIKVRKGKLVYPK
jgi:hypothetical protein